METLNYFNQIAAVFLNPEVKAWKEKNNLVIGVQCSGIPEEIIHAAGIMPMRVRAPGLTDTNKADAHLHRINCSYTRSVLEYLLSGKLDFLDGFVATNTCDHHLRLVSEIKDKSNFNFFHYFQMFHSLAHGSKEWLIKEMQELIKNIEGTLGIRITEDNLRNTISVYNKTRSLMAKVNELRKNDPPPISGTEYLNIVLAGISIQKEIFNEHLEAALPEFEKRSIYNKKLPRLLVVGGSCDLPGFIDFIESKGAYVVADGMCFGLRHYIGIIDDNISDPI